MSDLWGYGWRMGPEPTARLAMPQGGWYHASPHELPVGTVLTPGGGPTQYDRFYDRTDQDRSGHVWVDTLRNVKRRWADPDHFIYQVEPHADPQLFQRQVGRGMSVGGEDGYTVPGATITKVVRGHTAARLGGANGDLPENLHFREHQGWTHAYDGEHLIGYLRPAQGKIDMIKVAPEYRRQGIGTAMLDWHRNNVDPDLGHSTDQTPLGRAWGRSVGWNPPVWNRQDPDIDTLEDYEVERGPHTAARLAMPAPLQFPIEHLEPHNLYDPVAATDSDHYPDLVRHIREHGVQMPITLETDGELGLVADGNHRLAAAREAGLTHLPVRFLRESTRNLERWGGTPLHPAIQQHLADNPASIASTYDRQPSWAQGDYITSSRLAMPIYYHVTPRRNVDSIRQHGLDYTKGEAMWHHDGATPGNYFWDHPGHADQYANELDERDQQEYGSMNWDEENDGHVVLPFNHDALALPDPENEWNDEMEGRSFYSPDPIPAAAFHHTASHTAARLAMPTWYHLTDDPDFKLNPDQVPTNLNGQELGAGVYLTQRPEEWAGYDYPEGRWSADRPYIADIDAPSDLHLLPGAWHDLDSVRPDDPFPGSEETFVPADQFHHLTVQNVRPRKAKYMTAAVTVYTKPNCPQCTMTKKQLDRLGIEHRDIDVTVNPDAHAYVTGLGYTAAPVVVIGDGENHWAGFKPDRLKGLLS